MAEKGNFGRVERRELSRNKELEVSLGQLFPVFPQGLTKRIIDERYTHPSYDTYRVLVASTGDRIKFLVSADSYLRTHDHPVVAPFRPESGYRVDEYNFDDVAGPYKERQWMKNFDPASTDQLPLCFVHVGHDNDPDDPYVSEATYQMLDQLQLQLFVNGLRCQADNQKVDDLTRITIGTFYPLDSPPLPYLPDGGFEIVLPDDVEKLRTIQARFVLPQAPIPLFRRDATHK